MYYTRVSMQTNKTDQWPRWWRIVALSSTVSATEFAYAVEAGYGMPTLLKTGLEERYASLMWSASTVLGILFQGYMGAASDSCSCSWGRRRPFILMLGIVILLVLAMFPYGASIAQVLSLSAIVKHFVIPYTALLFVYMDFSLDAIQSPSRLYLLDSLSKERTQRGNLIYSTMMGLGATVGGTISAIPWKKVVGELGDNFETQTKIVFGFTLVLFTVCLVMTLFSVNENQTRALREPDVEKSEPATCTRCSFAAAVRNLCSYFQDTFLLVKNMSSTFLSLWVLTFLGNCALNGFYLFLTEYVGSVIYAGVADSDDPVLRNRYDEGVLAGCACITLCNVMLFLSSMLLDPVLDYFKVPVHVITMFGYLTYLCALGGAVLFPSLFSTLVASFTCGVFYALIVSVPFTLLAQYKRCGVLLRGGAGKQLSENVMGKAVSLHFMAVFGSQLILGLCQGNFIHLFGTSRVIMIIVFIAQLSGTGFLIFNLDKFTVS